MLARDCTTLEDEAAEPLLQDTSMSSYNEQDTPYAVSVSQDDVSEKLIKTDWQPIESHSFIPALEGIRGIAVIFAHLIHTLARPVLMRDVIGPAGVTVFFVLSGFLITGVLMRLQAQSKDAFSYRHLPRFYADRAVRLAPALLFLVGVMSPLFVWQGVKATHVIRYALMALCYLTNVTSLWVKNSPGIFSNTWSLACEEHFYIVWSLLLPFVCRASPRLRVPLIAGLIAASLSLRIYTGMYPGSFFGAHYYFNSFNNFWKMLLGASLRLVPIPPRFLKRRWAYIGLGGIFAMLAFIAAVPSKPILTFLATLAPGWKDYKAAIRTWTDPVVAVCSLLIVCGSHDAEGGPKILESQLLRFTGRISYAWYLWQLPLIDCFGGKISGKPIAYGNTAIAFMVAMFSTIYVEEPIRATYVAWKKRRSAREMSIESRMS